MVHCGNAVEFIFAMEKAFSMEFSSYTWKMEYKDGIYNEKMKA